MTGAGWGWWLGVVAAELGKREEALRYVRHAVKPFRWRGIEAPTTSVFMALSSTGSAAGIVIECLRLRLTK